MAQVVPAAPTQALEARAAIARFPALPPMVELARLLSVKVVQAVDCLALAATLPCRRIPEEGCQRISHPQQKFITKVVEVARQRTTTQATYTAAALYGAAAEEAATAAALYGAVLAEVEHSQPTLLEWVACHCTAATVELGFVGPVRRRAALRRVVLADRWAIQVRVKAALVPVAKCESGG